MAHKTTLIADCGGTKADWAVVRAGHPTQRLYTSGINAAVADSTQIRETIRKELLPQLGGEEPDAVFFYGAGCNGVFSHKVEEVLAEAFPKAVEVEVEGDMLGAARALLGDSAGVACIMGTGSNSCLYDGRHITANTPPLGYILGDEGGGAAIGKAFFKALLRGTLPEDIAKAYSAETGLERNGIIGNVYGGEAPNRFLASACPFVRRHIGEPELERMVTRCMSRFIRSNILPYGPGLPPICATGGVAAAFGRQLGKAAEAEGLAIGRVEARPMDGLIRYHETKNRQT